MYKANWKLKEYKVTFVTNGGSKVAAQTVKIHKTAQKPPNPKRKDTPSRAGTRTNP